MDSINYLLSIESRGIKMGMNRTEKIMNLCGNPQKGIASIQVAGTNGKGSVCAMLANIFKTAGYKTGLFTSPHLIRVNERIRINGTPITNNEIDYFIQKYKTDIEEINASFFETITAIAFWYFNKNNVDIAILETGLGGRLDSVSICEPILTIITPIALDHIEILGNTLDKIAFEKAGIFKKNIYCISAQQDKCVADVLYSEANIKNTPIAFIKNNKKNIPGLPIYGTHQHNNAKLVTFSISFINGYDISNKIIKNGLNSVKWFGRNQIIQKKPLVIFDVAHNSAGIKSFINYYSSLKIETTSILIIALQARKQIFDTIPALQRSFQKIVCTETEGHNPMSANELSSLFDNRNILIMPNPIEAITWGLNNINNAGCLAIIGSHFLGPAVSNIFKLSFDQT